MKDKKLNISKEKIRMKILYKVEDGGGLNISQLDKNIRNFNRTPGINAIAQLEEGKKFGETDIVITASNTKTITGSSLADNTGSRSSGTGKLTNTLNIDGLFNIGDRFTFTNVATGNNFQKDKQKEESNYYAMSTTFPMGYNGMQGTFRLSKMEYKLSAPFDSTMPSGYSTEYNFTLTRPLIEKLTKNLNATFLVSRNDYVNNLSTGNNSNKDMTKATFNLGFDGTDTKLGGGVNYGLVGITLGNLDLKDNLSNYSTDQAGADNNGRNLKATFNFNRLQKITNKTNILVKFNGQVAADNLDGGEQFNIG
jgi:Hemolysin activation/secretion protein